MNGHNLGQYKPMDAGANSNYYSIQTIDLEIRAFELKLLDPYSRGKNRGTVHTCWGQEIPPVVVSTLMTESDQLFGTHRGHGYFMAITKDQDGLAIKSKAANFYKLISP
jgi:TPP-dependent pyruvate/acetoin dehydrogenase alpha subunit